jgi:hypothetical protein
MMSGRVRAPARALFPFAQESSMFDDKHRPRSREAEVEFWARALGVSPQRLIALVEEIVNERLCPAVSLVPAKIPSTP